MKIEIEKPVIPQFVADWIEQLYGQGFNSDDLLEALFSRNYEVAELKILKWFTDDKERAVTAILYGYEVEKEPFFYARVKGWENKYLDGPFYWNHIAFSGNIHKLGIDDYVHDRKHSSIYAKTKAEWNDLGINDTNADFEKVE